MLLAEINGKSCPEVEGLEDLITSAVFGHLRLINPPRFWAELFRRARTVETPSRSFAEILHSVNTDPDLYTHLEVRFWKCLLGYDEPDLLVRFTGPSVQPIVLIIEVKLNSGKSGYGELDQLARYISTLDKPQCLPEWPCDSDKRFLLYLTRNFATEDLNESVRASNSVATRQRMFGVEWNDILEIANEQRQGDDLLGEVADFLKRRGFERFCGFTPAPAQLLPSGRFYNRSFFEQATCLEITNGGHFYGT